MKIAITGTPGTGKTSISKEIAEELNCDVVHVNELVKKKKLYSKIEKKEHIADFRKLRKELVKLMKATSIIVESHLLSDLKLPADLVIVMRCNPEELEKRLDRRKYPKTKINDNVLCEMLDYCLINAIENYGERKVMQIDATKKVSAKTAMKKIVKFVKTGKSDSARWLHNLDSGLLLRLES
ncbi:MAG: adenylate kinase family protein [Candidatus Micrarchaeota archaeon]